MMKPIWDVFCRVIDNHGDVGVCWRLARALAVRGVAVRLWIDDASALAWMAPLGHADVQVLPWPDQPVVAPPGDVVIEAFGCDLPAHFMARMAARLPQPVWINLEYLSAEDYVERSHQLRSPQWHGPAAGLDKWFFYPGFTTRTGGLLHDLAPDDASTSANLPQARTGERVINLFCYRDADLAGLLHAWSGGAPTLLRVLPGPAQAELAAMADGTLPPAVRWVALPHLSQPGFDRLLAQADLNLVRGEDSFARAQIQAEAPFLWHIYPQDDGAHAAKLEAFLTHYLAGAEPDLAACVAGWFRAFNRLGPAPGHWPDDAGWRAHHARWRQGLLAQDDLCTQLMRFVALRAPQIGISPHPG